jgi:hypothetical protein
MEFTILGRRVTGQIGDPVRSWLHDDWVAPLPPTATETGIRPSSFTISLTQSAQPVPLDVALAQAAFGPLGTRHIRVGPDQFWILEETDGRLDGVYGSLDDGGATIRLHGAPFGGAIALRNAMVEALGASGIIRLHAAAINDGTNTLALLGPTGRGKSTTLLRAVMGGWRPIAEDACLLDPATLRIIGVDRILRVRPEALTVLGSTLGEVDPGPLIEGRHEIGYDQLGGLVPVAGLTHLVRLVRNSARHSRWKPLGAAKAVMALHQSTGIANTDRVGRSNATSFGQIVRATRTVDLELGAATSPLPPVTELHQI